MHSHIEPFTTVGRHRTVVGVGGITFLFLISDVCFSETYSIVLTSCIMGLVVRRRSWEDRSLQAITILVPLRCIWANDHDMYKNTMMTVPHANVMTPYDD